MTCRHASNGCNYPEGECSGACLRMKIEAKWATPIKSETLLKQGPWPLGVWFMREAINTIKATRWELLVARMFGRKFDTEANGVRYAFIERKGKVYFMGSLPPAKAGACPPCNQRCNQGRACPARTVNLAAIREKIHDEHRTGLDG